MTAVGIHLIGGFLGAGKTTAIRHLLRQLEGERVAVVVNDFGLAGLDASDLQGSGRAEIRAIPGGCVCCTAPEGFVASVGELLDLGFQRVLVEPTGLARPQDLVDTLRRSPHRERIEVGAVIVLVDPRASEAPELRRAQLEAADVVVLNHVDQAEAAQLESAEAEIAELWPPPLVVERVRHGAISRGLLDLASAAASRVGSASEASTAGFAVRSFAAPPEELFSAERLRAAFAGWAAASVLRAKGVFRTREGVLRFDVVGAEVDESPAAFRRGSVADVIAAEGSPELAAAEALLDAARLTKEERIVEANRLELSFPDGRSRVFDREWLAALPGGVADVGALFPGRSGEAARLRAIWAAAGAPSAGHVVVEAADGFASSPVSVAALLEGILLHSEGGQALDAKQGGPFRLLIPEQAGAPLGNCANVKGVVRMAIRESIGEARR